MAIHTSDQPGNAQPSLECHLACSGSGFRVDVCGMLIHAQTFVVWNHWLVFRKWFCYVLYVVYYYKDFQEIAVEGCHRKVYCMYLQKHLKNRDRFVGVLHFFGVEEASI
jgi:hypothetical protein